MRIVGLVVIAACGRIGFDATRDGAVIGRDGASDVGVDAPLDLGPFGTPTELAPLTTVSQDFGPAWSQDLLEVYVAQRFTGDADIYRFTRADAASPFAGGVRVAAVSVTGPGNEDGEPSLSNDGLTLYVDRILPDDRIVGSTRSSPTATDWTTAVPIASLDGFHSAEFVTDLHVVVVDDQGIIHEARRATTSDAWSTPVSLGFAGLVPCMRADALEILYEGSVMIGGQLSVAIHRRLRARADDPFGPEERLSFGPLDVAGVGDPELSPDGRNLLFSAQVAPGNTYDIYIATR